MTVETFRVGHSYASVLFEHTTAAGFEHTTATAGYQLPPVSCIIYFAESKQTSSSSLLSGSGAVLKDMMQSKKSETATTADKGSFLSLRQANSSIALDTPIVLPGVFLLLQTHD